MVIVHEFLLTWYFRQIYWQLESIFITSLHKVKKVGIILVLSLYSAGETYQALLELYQTWPKLVQWFKGKLLMHRRPNFSSNLKLVNSFWHPKFWMSCFCEFAICVLHGFPSPLELITLIFTYLVYFNVGVETLYSNKSFVTNLVY